MIYVSILTWNIEGLLDKLKFTDVKAYLKTFDIFALLETLVQNVENIDNIFAAYEVYFYAAKKLKTYGRAMSGLVVFVKRNLCDHIQRLNNDCDFAIFLRLSKHVLHRDKDILLCFVYLPPENSPFYKGKEIKGTALLENKLFDIILKM